MVSAGDTTVHAVDPSFGEEEVFRVMRWGIFHAGAAARDGWESSHFKGIMVMGCMQGKAGIYIFWGFTYCGLNSTPRTCCPEVGW